jgi:hypothetical protein
MAHRAFSALGIAALSFSLAACGGGGGSSGSSAFPGPGPTAGPGSVLISPTSLAFAGPGAPSQTFTVSSSLGNVNGAPAVDPIGCAPVANIATASTSLPATYTVTPTGNGSCSFVVTINHQSATIGITVGGSGSGPALSTSAGAVTLFVGGTSGSVTVSASSGTLIPDASACAGIASVSGAGGASPQTFTISPLAAGSCTFTVVDGASSVSVPVTVNASGSGQNALFITPSSLDFASQAAPAQQATLSFSGNAGQVSVNENDCIGQTGKPKLVFVTIGTPGQPVSLPATVTVTPYTTQGGGGSGTCSIFFTSSVGATQAVLTVTVH